MSVCELNSPARWRRRWVQHTALRWACSRRPRRWKPWLCQPAWQRVGSREGELPLLSLSIDDYLSFLRRFLSVLPLPALDSMTPFPLTLYWEPVLSRWGAEVLCWKKKYLLHSPVSISCGLSISAYLGCSFCLSSSFLFMSLCKIFSSLSHIQFAKRSTGTVVHGEQLQLSNVLSSGPSLLWFWQTGVLCTLCVCSLPLPVTSTLHNIHTPCSQWHS